MNEHQTIEWKESWRDEYLKWICGFANAQGGTLVIGKNDRGKVVGIKDARKLIQDIPNKVRDILGILVDVNLKTEQGLPVLEIVVAPYPYPVSYKGEYYYRTGGTKQELKGAALDRFLLRKQGRHWDGVPIPHFTVADLSPQALATFRKKAAKSKRLSAELLAESDAVLLDKLKLFEHGYLKRAAVMLFHEDPERVVTGAYVKIGYFRTDSDLLYHDEIHGNLFSQVEKTLDLLLTKYLRAGISYEGVQRIEAFPVPEPALREAVINAIAHKDYASAIPIQISVYHEKLMIWNAGQLPQDWTIERLTAKHASAPHNPDIANAFFRVAFMESWGRGIDLIRNACRAAGKPEPSFRWDNGLWVEFSLQEAETPVKTPVKTPGKTGEVSRVTPPVTAQVAAQVTDVDNAQWDRVLHDITRVFPSATAQVTAQVAAQVGHLCREPRAAREIMQHLHLRHWKTFQANYLGPLLQDGLLERTIPDKPTSRLQKYRLTVKGSALLARMKKA